MPTEVDPRLAVPSNSDQDEELKMTIMHRRSRHSIPIGDNLGRLLLAIEHLTGVRREEQILVARGKKIDLSNWDASPEQVGIGEGTVALVLRGRNPANRTKGTQSSSTARGNTPASTDSTCDTLPPCLRHIRDAEKSVAQLRDELNQANDAVSRHTQGFLDRKMTDDALRKDDLLARGLDEKLMKLLEYLDGLQPPEQTGEENERLRAQWRAERKALVGKTQTALKDVDSLRDRIRSLRDDKYGEVEHRRGNMS